MFEITIVFPYQSGLGWLQKVLISAERAGGDEDNTHSFLSFYDQ